MAKKALKITTNYGNSYEAMRDQLKNNPFFDEKEWLDISRGNRGGMDLDMYITTLLNTDKIEDLDKFYSDYNYSFADSKTKTAALYNEIFADRTNVKEKRQRPIYNDAGAIMLDSEGKPMYEEYFASDYEYYKSILKQQNDRNYEEFLLQQEQERKDSSSKFLLFLSSLTAGATTSAVSGIASIINGVAGTTAGLLGGASRAMRGENFADAFIDIATDDKYRFLQFIEDWAVEFESRYTNLRNLDGSYTNIGKYIGGISTTLGQMLPSMLVAKGLPAVGKLAGASGNVAASIGKGASIVSQLIYYQGITGANIKDMYEQFASEGISVNSAAVLSNAAVKSVFEYAIEIGLGKLMGGTAVDNIIFGRTSGKSVSKGGLASAALKRVLRDAGQEGLEEVLQDTSSFLVDRAYMMLINENFGNITELNAQSLSDAFFIGAIVSIGGAAKGVAITSSNKAKKLGIEGNYLTRKLRAWEYGLNVQSFIENYHDVLEIGENLDISKDISAKEFVEKVIKAGKELGKGEAVIAAMTEMVAAYRMLTSIYGEIGAERFEAANKLLTEITTNIRNGKFEVTTVHNAAENMYDSLFGSNLNTNMPALYALEKISKAESKEEAVKKIEEGGHSKIDEVVSRSSDISDVATIDEDTKKEIDTLFEERTDVDNIVITADGNKTTTIGNTVLIPRRELDNAGANVILQELFEQNLVDAVVNGHFTKGKLYLDELLDTYKKSTGEESATVKDAVYSLLLDPNARLFEMMLITSNKDTLRFLSSLLATAKNVTRVEDIKVPSNIKPHTEAYYDALEELTPKGYKERTRAQTYFDKLFVKFRNCIYNYLIAQPNAELSDYTNLFSDVDIKEIRKLRWSNDIYSRVIRNEALTENDVRFLHVKINYMDRPEDVKRTLITNIKSPNVKDRKSALDIISKYYDDQFQNKYDGNTYMPNTNIANMTFNNYLVDIGRTLKDFLGTITDAERLAITSEYKDVTSTTIFQYRQNEFDRRTNGLYSFVVDKKGKISIRNSKTKKSEGFSYYYKNADSIVAGNKVGRGASSLLTPSSLPVTEIKSIMRSDLSDVEKSMISLTDIIYNPELLSESAYNDLKAKYPSMDAESTFIFLRNLVTTITNKSCTLSMTPNGECIICNLSYMNKIIPASTEIKIDKDSKLSDFASDKYLTDFSKNTKVILTDDNIVAEYRPYKVENIDGTAVRTVDNTIYVNKKVYSDGGAYLRFALLHEMQHVIQFENKMNLGLDTGFVTYLSKKEQLRLVGSVRKHMPHLFTKEMSDEAMLKIASDYVYYASGESEALGLGGTKYADFYPVIVKNTNKNTIIRFSWGDEFVIDGVVRTPGNMSLKKLADNLYQVTDIGDFFSSFEIDGRISDRNLRNRERLQQISDKFVFPFDKKYEKLTSLYTGGGFDVNYNREDVKAKYKEYMLDISHKPLRLKMIDLLRQIVAPDMRLEEFVEADVPYIRLQTSAELNDSPLVSVYAGITSTYGIQHLLNVALMSRGESFFPEVYLLVGTFKPKDCLSYWPTGLSEAMIEPSKLVGSKMFRLSTDSYITGNHDVPLSPDIVEGLPLTDDDGIIHTKYKWVSEYVDPYLGYGDYTFVDWNTGKEFYLTDVDADSRVRLSSQLQYSYDNLDDYYSKELDEGAIFYATSEDGRVITDEEVTRPLGPYVPKMSLAKTVDDETKPVKKTPGRKRKAKSYVTKARVKGTGNRRATFAKKSTNIVEREKDGILYREYHYEPKYRYITAEEAKDSNLRYFRKPGAQYDPDFKKFVVLATGDNAVADVLQDKINGSKKGTLTKKDVENYFRKTPLDKMDPVTFRVINEAFYGNKEITTPQKLGEVLDKLPDYYAVRAVAISLGYRENLMDNSNPHLYDALLEIILKNPKLSTLYNQVKDRYYTFKGDNIESYFNEGLARHNAMSYFDASLHRAGHVASLSKTASIISYVTGASVSLDSVVGDLKSEGGGRALEEMIADESSNLETKVYYESMEDLDLTDAKERQIYKIMSYVSKKLFPKAAKKGVSENAILKVFLDTLNDLVDRDVKDISKFAKDFADEDVRRAYVTLLLTEMLNVDVNNATEKQLETLVVVADSIKSKQDYSLSIRGYLRTINKHCNINMAKRVVKENSDLLEIKGDVIILKPLTYKNEVVNKNGSKSLRLKEAEELAPIADRLRELSISVRKGEYSSDEALKLKKYYEKERKKLLESVTNNEKVKSAKNIKAVEISDDLLEFDSSKEMPKILQKLLDYEFTETARSKTKYLTNENSQHYRNNFNAFVENNADTLSKLTDSDVQDILDWYFNSYIISGRITERRKEVYDATEVYLLTYILKTVSSDFALTSEQREKIEAYVERKVRGFATGLSNWRVASAQLNPDKIIVNSLRKRFNVEFSEDTIDTLGTALTDYFKKDAVDELPYDFPKMSRDEKIEALRKAKMLPKNFDKMSTSEQVKAIDKISTKKRKRRDIFSDIERAKNDMLTQATEQYKKHGVSIWDRLLTLQQSFMLSGPGTWVRNVLSNVSLSYFNFFAEHIGETTSYLLGKVKSPVLTRNRVDITSDMRKENVSYNSKLRDLETRLEATDQRKIKVSIKDQIRELKAKHSERLSELEKEMYYSSQYKITGTKVSSEVSEFIGKSVNPLLSLVGDDMSKYDPRSSDRKTSSVQIVELIAANMTSRLYREELAKFEPGDTKTQQFVAKAWNSTAGKFIPFVFKMMSDDKFVHKAAVQYLGKMLTEDLEFQKTLSAEQAKVKSKIDAIRKKYQSDIADVKSEFTTVEKEIREKYRKATGSPEYLRVREREDVSRERKKRDDKIKALERKMREELAPLNVELESISFHDGVISLDSVDNSVILKYIADAYTMASFDYMHKTNFWNKAEAELRKWGGPKFMFMYKQIMPFASAGWNWFMESLQYTPAALAINIHKLYKLEKVIDDLENKRQKGSKVPDSRMAKYITTRNIGKGIIGTVNFILGSLFAAFGWVALDEEDDKYKLKIGDTYIDISAAYGSSGLWAGMTTMAMVIDVTKNGDEFEFSDVMGIITAAFDTMFADSAFSDLHNTFRYNDSVGDWLVELPMNTLNMFVPNFVKTITSALVIYDIEYDEGVVGDLERYVASFVPFLAYAFPKYVDPYTGQTQLAYNFSWLDTEDRLGAGFATLIFNAINKLSTVDISPYNISDTEKTAVELGVRKSMLTGRYTVKGQDVKLSKSDVQKLNEFYGELNKNELNKLMSNKVRYEVKNDKDKYVKLTFEQMTEEQKRTVIERIMSNNGSYAKIYILTSSGNYKYYANSSEYVKLRNLGITENVYRSSGKNEGFVPIT